METARKPISKKTRFEVFKRDSFTCQYCGSHPPQVILEPDHINPVANGGGNEMDNLITACFDCNRGKGARLLTALPESLEDRAAMMTEKLEQIKAYERLVKSMRKRIEASVDKVQAAFQCYFPDKQFTEAFRQSARTFLKSLDQDDLVEYMHKACAKRSNDAFDATKYFCGICWNVIKDRKNG